jgi:hypothetical protein
VGLPETLDDAEILKELMPESHLMSRLGEHHLSAGGLFLDAPAGLGGYEAQAAASCCLTSPWNVEKDLPAWLSVDDAVEAVARPVAVLPIGGDVPWVIEKDPLAWLVVCDAAEVVRKPEATFHWKEASSLIDGR